MRSLSHEEQDLCQRILRGNGSNNFLSNIIDNRLERACIELNTNSGEVRFLVESSEPQLIADAEAIFRRMREVSVTIVTAINLLQMLEKDGYIMLYRSANNISSISTFGQCARNLPNVPYKFADPAISKILIDYHSKEIITTQAFTEFCQRGYIARDEQRYKRQVTIATIAVCVSTASCFFSAFTLYKNATSTTNDTMLLNSTNAVQQLTTLNAALVKVERNSSGVVGKVDTILTNQSRQIKALGVGARKIKTRKGHKI